MNTDLRKTAKNYFEKDFFKLINNLVILRDIKSITTERRRNVLVSEPNYHTAKFFPENSLAIEMRKTQTPMNKPVHLGFSILYLSKTVMSEFWYDSVKRMIFINALQKMMKQDLILQFTSRKEQESYWCNER